MNIVFQSLPTATESSDSVSSVAGRSMCGCPVAAVRRRRPRLSAPTPPLGCHDATPIASRPHSPPQRSLSSPFLPRRAPPRVSDSARALLPVSGQASPPKASPASSTPASPPWPLSGVGKAALPSSEPFFLARVPRSSPPTCPGLPTPPFPLIFVPKASS